MTIYLFSVLLYA
ncbi:CPXV186 protein [Cowpox virus]|uniref:CPXV186 protein n=1 Tax=Cowpox virus TaxID=10243 RepID=U5TEW0_COWPX|nr:CPXV186 protein [Cowpox virus]AGY98311.1 CPXV186 protein [Cowpox virus]AGY99381.1 CPXV186 protein [Cowpox virus]AGZ00233.1 CPXV186 protein [Cowpox virus]AGZ00863.1 CPXV186 protein [Cowpox virus]